MTDEERAASEKRIGDGAEAIREALLGPLDENGVAGEEPPHCPQNLGELADTIACFVYSANGVIVQSGLTRIVIDKLIDALQMEYAASVPSLVDILRAGQTKTVDMRGLFDLAEAFEKTRERTGATDDAPDAPGMYL